LVHYPGYELAPDVLVVMAEVSELVVDFLDLLFCLAIRLLLVEDRLTVTLSLKKLFHTSEINCGPQSKIMSSRRSK